MTVDVALPEMHSETETLARLMTSPRPGNKRRTPENEEDYLMRVALGVFGVHLRKPSPVYENDLRPNSNPVFTIELQYAKQNNRIVKYESDVGRHLLPVLQ